MSSSEEPNRLAGSMQMYSFSTKSKAKPMPFIMDNAFLEALIKSTLFLPSLLFLISLLLFVMVCPRALSNGDAALYVQQIRDLDFTHRTVHLGYYVLGIPFIHLLPFPIDHALNLMSCVYAALCVSVLFLITALITSNKPASFAACVMLLTNHLFASNAVFAEVYVPQLFFYLLSLYLLLINRPVSAAFSFATSFLITPSAIFGIPMLIPFRRDKQLLSRFGMSALLLLIIALSPFASDYILGGRGLLKAHHASLSIGAALLKEYREFFSDILWYAPFLVAGIIETIRCVKYRDWGVAILFIWLLTFMGGERFGDVPVQLPCYLFICMIGGLGFAAALQHLCEKSRFLAAALYPLFLLVVTLCGITALTHINKTISYNEEYRNTVFALQHAAQPGFIALGPWTQGILFEQYLYGTSYTGVWINTEWLAGTWGTAQRNESREALSRAILSSREIWLLTYDAPLFSQLQKKGYSINPFGTVFRATPANTSGS